MPLQKDHLDRLVAQLSPPILSSNDWKNRFALGATPRMVPPDPEPSPSTEPATWVP